jgi:hypothetical protein
MRGANREVSADAAWGQAAYRVSEKVISVVFRWFGSMEGLSIFHWFSLRPCDILGTDSGQ